MPAEIIQILKETNRFIFQNVTLTIFLPGQKVQDMADKRTLKLN